MTTDAPYRQQANTETTVVKIHAGVVILVLIAATILAALNKIDNGAIVAIFSTALGFAGAKATTPPGRTRNTDRDND